MQVSRDKLLEAYRSMKTIREFEERVAKEFATGDLPSVRNWRLQNGVSPRAQYKGSSLPSLPVPSGKQAMYAEPNSAHNLSAWSGELATMGTTFLTRENRSRPSLIRSS